MDLSSLIENIANRQLENIHERNETEINTDLHFENFNFRVSKKKYKPFELLNSGNSW